LYLYQNKIKKKRELNPVCWSDDEKSNDSVIDLTMSPKLEDRKRKREKSGVQTVKITKVIIISLYMCWQ